MEALFFTINLLERQENNFFVRRIDSRRKSIRHVKQKHPFAIHTWEILPDHVHCAIEHPKGDANLPLAWRLINMSLLKVSLTGRIYRLFEKNIDPTRLGERV